MVRTYESTGAKYGLTPADVEGKVQSACAKLKERRDKDRPRPGLDDKILCGWNGLMVRLHLNVSSCPECIPLNPIS